ARPRTEFSTDYQSPLRATQNTGYVRRMNLRTPVATAIAGLLAVLLAACSPATAPEFSPSAPFEPARTESVASPSPTESPSPTAEPSPNAVIEIPDSAYLEDLQGAIDVATLYVTLHPALYQGGQGG